MPNEILQAILWDGQRQLKGYIHLGNQGLRFKMLDFAETDLDLGIKYNDIRRVEYYQLYDLKTQGLQIKTQCQKNNVFIVEEPLEVKKQIEERMKNT